MTVDLANVLPKSLVSQIKKMETKDTKGHPEDAELGTNSFPTEPPPQTEPFFSQHSENRLHRHAIDSHSSSTPSPENTSPSKALRLQ